MPTAALEGPSRCWRYGLCYVKAGTCMGEHPCSTFCSATGVSANGRSSLLQVPPRWREPVANSWEPVDVYDFGEWIEGECCKYDPRYIKAIWGEHVRLIDLLLRNSEQPCRQPAL